jgi:hypothetical protein
MDSLHWLRPMRATAFLFVLAALSTGAGCGEEVTLGTGGAGMDGASAADPYSGPFNVLVLSLTTGFHHDSIPAIHQMLRELGPCVDAPSCAMTGDEVIGTQGDVVLQPGFENHPVVRGLPALWSATDEWYVFNSTVAV